jgi:hypothetical protein
VSLHRGERHKKNLLVLDKIFLRASHPDYWGKVTLQFEAGRLRNVFNINSTIKVGEKADEELDGLLDATMGPDGLTPDG